MRSGGESEVMDNDDQTTMIPSKSRCKLVRASIVDLKKLAEINLHTGCINTRQMSFLVVISNPVLVGKPISGRWNITE